MEDELQCSEVCGNRTGASSSCSNSSMGPETEDGSEAEGVLHTGSVSCINVAPFGIQHESGNEAVHSTAASSSSLRAVSALEDDKFCCVCGDRALGYNFDAITCESCKAFFRRNAAKQDTMKCMFSGDCSITINTRRFCSACRLRKCFHVGMKKDMILGEQEKKYRKEKVLLNKEKRLRKQQLLQHDILHQQKQAHSIGSGITLSTAAGVPVVGSALPVLTSPPANLAAFCTSITDRVTPLLGSGAGQGSCRVRNVPDHNSGSSLCSKDASLWPPSFMRNDKASYGTDSCCPNGHCGGRRAPAAGVGCGLSNCCRDGTVWSPAVACASHVGVVKPMLPVAMSVDDQPAASGVRRELGDDELVVLDSLEHAYDVTIGVGCDESDEGGSVNWNKCNSLELFLNHTGSFVRQFVAFSKRLHEFSALPQNVQMTLLKSSVLGSMILRSAHVYDLDSDCWVNSRGERTSLDVLSAAFADVEPGLRDMHSSLVRSIKQLVLARTTENGSARQAGNSSAGSAAAAAGKLIFALLHCIALLSPEYIRPLDDEDSDDGDRRAVAAVVAAVSDAQLRYIALLRRHLEASVSYAGASELLPNFLQCLTMCKYYARQHGKAIMSCDASRVEPLLREVFNL